MLEMELGRVSGQPVGTDPSTWAAVTLMTQTTCLAVAVGLVRKVGIAIRPLLIPGLRTTMVLWLKAEPMDRTSFSKCISTRLTAGMQAAEDNL